VLVAAGDEVIAWFDLCTSVAPPSPPATAAAAATATTTTTTTNWMHVEDRKIVRIRVTFHPRGLLAGFEKQG
jgi:hypothetical protein